MNRRVAPLVAFVPACVVLTISFAQTVGCSSRPAETGMSNRPAKAATETTVVATAGQRSQGAHGQRPVRPIPEVIAKAKPFRMMPQSTARAIPSPTQDTTASGVATASAVMPSSKASRPTTGPDIAGINRVMRSYLEAFNRHDPAALAAHWSATGENLDLDSGETTAGRDAVHEVFAALFEQDAGATIDIDVAAIRPLRDDVAVVDGVSRISFTDAPPSSSRFSAVLVRENGNWVLDTVRESNTSSQPSHEGTVANAQARPLDAMAWLVGSWEDVSEGVTASTHCFWSTNRAFLIRTHVVSTEAAHEQRRLPGGSGIPGLLSANAAGSREITEILGWDPDRGQIRSWLFTSDGRFAEGAWSRDGNAWTLRLTDASGDCHCTITRVGPDEMSCRCDSDQFADVVPPACDFVRTARAADATTKPEPPSTRASAPGSKRQSSEFPSVR